MANMSENNKIMHRPTRNEANDYYWKYINLAEGENPIDLLSTNKSSSLHLFAGLDEATWNYAYTPGKWTVKEALVHIIDTERIMTYRALRIGRGDKTPIEGFEQDDYVLPSKAALRTPASILSEYDAVREATIALFKQMDDEMLGYFGQASGFPFTARALAFIIPGHEVHHRNIFRERYGF